MFTIPGAQTVKLQEDALSRNPLEDKPKNNVSRLSTSKYVDSVNEKLTMNVRNYFDEVFGPLIRSLDMSLQINTYESVDDIQTTSHIFSYIGSIIDSILRYNNVNFKISVHEVSQSYNIPEPLWFHFTKNNLNQLYIFVCTNWYIEYVSIRTNVPIIWCDGQVPLSLFNPSGEEAPVELDTAKIKCVTTCNHLAQHILYRYYSKEAPLSQADIHESWTEPKVGETFHSILKLKSLYTNSDKKQFQSNSLNISIQQNVSHLF